MMRNETSFGRPIFKEADPLSVKIGKQFAHFAEGLMPGVSPIDIKSDALSPLPFGLTLKARDLPKAVGQTIGLLEQEDLAKRSGIRIDPAGEFMEALTGLKTIKPRVKDNLKYQAYAASPQASSANKIFNQLASTRGKADAEDLNAMADIRSQFQGAPFRPQAEAEAQAAQATVAPTPTQPQLAPPIAPTQPSTAPTSLFSRGTDALRQIELNKLLGID